jgi:hypothetical protein
MQDLIFFPISNSTYHKQNPTIAFYFNKQNQSTKKQCRTIIPKTKIITRFEHQKTTLDLRHNKKKSITSAKSGN